MSRREDHDDGLVEGAFAIFLVAAVVIPLLILLWKAALSW